MEPNEGTATAPAAVREDGTLLGFPDQPANRKTRFSGQPQVTSAGAVPFFPCLAAVAGANFIAYGMATVRLYVGAVKRVALPIVSQAINGRDAHRFPQDGVGVIPFFTKV